jgi:hypothetical protein
MNVGLRSLWGRYGRPDADPIVIRRVRRFVVMLPRDGATLRA